MLSRTKPGVRSGPARVFWSACRLGLQAVLPSVALGPLLPSSSPILPKFGLWRRGAATPPSALVLSASLFPALLLGARPVLVSRLSLQLPASQFSIIFSPSTFSSFFFPSLSQHLPSKGTKLRTQPRNGIVASAENHTRLSRVRNKGAPAVLTCQTSQVYVRTQTQPAPRSPSTPGPASSCLPTRTRPNETRRLGHVLTPTPPASWPLFCLPSFFFLSAHSSPRGDPRSAAPQSLHASSLETEPQPPPGAQSSQVLRPLWFPTASLGRRVSRNRCLCPSVRLREDTYQIAIFSRKLVDSLLARPRTSVRFIQDSAVLSRLARLLSLVLSPRISLLRRDIIYSYLWQRVWH
ncbi:hypothetical protein L209DRAFT_246255 [Thermothelomyces heterothallicus CBS 203.75]